MSFDIALNDGQSGFSVIDTTSGRAVAEFEYMDEAREHLRLLFTDAAAAAAARASLSEGASSMDDDFIRLESASGLTAEDITEDGRQWIHVMPVAEKAKNGPWFFTITRADLDTYADFVRANPERIPVDYDHGGGRTQAGGSTRAAGWFTGKAIVIDPGARRPTKAQDAAESPELWAEVKWTPRALQEVRDGEFRFISPEFSFEERDTKTGLMTKAKELVAATLTNRPFFRQLAPVTAHELPEELLAGVADAFGAEVAADLSSDDEEARQRAVEAILGAVWSTAYVNNLPDSSFFYIAPGGDKDEDGKTTPRTLRYFPYRDADGTVDMPHLRNAIARAPQADLPQDVIESVQDRARRMLERMTAAAADDAEGDPTPSDESGEPDEAAPEGAPADAPDEPEDPAAEVTPDEPADPESNDSEQEDIMSEVSTNVLAALGVPEHADEATILAAVQAKDEEIATLKGEIDNLKAVEGQAHELANRVAGLEAAARKREVAIVLADEVRTGRVAPVEVEHLARHYESNIDGLKELVNARPMGMFAGIKEVGSGSEGLATDPKLAALADEFRASDPIDPESGALHVKAVEILEARGKVTYTSEEYLAALDEASKAA